MNQSLCQKKNTSLGDVLVTTYDGGVMVVNMNMRGSWIRCNIIERKIPDSQRAKDMV